MDIETLIKKHNDVLEQKTEANPFLAQRIKANLNTGGTGRAGSGRSVLRRLQKTALLYGVLFVILTLLNIVVVGKLKQKSPEQHYIAQFEAFHPDSPGSLSHAYAEVIKWENH